MAHLRAAVGERKSGKINSIENDIISQLNIQKSQAPEKNGGLIVQLIVQFQGSFVSARMHSPQGHCSPSIQHSIRFTTHEFINFANLLCSFIALSTPILAYRISCARSVHLSFWIIIMNNNHRLWLASLQVPHIYSIFSFIQNWYAIICSLLNNIVRRPSRWQRSWRRRSARAGIRAATTDE